MRQGVSPLRLVHELDPRMRCYLWKDVFDAHRDDGKRYVVRADEKLTAFRELESAVEPFSASSFL